MNKRAKQLQKARRIRSRITTQTRQLHDGHITLTDVLEDPKRYSLGRLTVYALLCRSPGLSSKGAKKILLETKVWPLDRVRDIDLFNREEVIKALPPRARR